jgi:DNA-binding IclR family transcriptional regulator
MARSFGINKATSHSILRTLQEHGYVQQNPQNSKYRIGFKILELGTKLLDAVDLRRQARPFLEALRDATSETVNLMIYDELAEDCCGVYADILQSRHVLRMVAQVGTREELHCTGVGKAILAFLPEDTIRRLLGKRSLPRKTPRTIVDPGELLRHLAAIRRCGYAVDNEESEPGIRCVGAPLFDHRNRVAGSVSIAAPSIRFTLQRCKIIAPMVVATAEKISQTQGGANRNNG